MLDVPIVVSVPKNIKCLSGVDTKLKLDDVGALASIVALVALAVVGSESHSNVSPPDIVAISLLPKLSNDHSPGAVTMSPDAAAFHAKKFDASVTVAPDLNVLQPWSLLHLSLTQIMYHHYFLYK